MFYKMMVKIVQFVIWIINGNVKYEGLEHLPKNESYIMVAPHRTWWEPLLFALAVKPTPCAFMAKKELFKNPIIAFIIKHSNAFPVDRQHPGPSTVKVPVKDLNKRNLSLIMFPSGTRYSSQLKGGAVLIAKLSKKPLVPVVYQGPLTFSGFLKRKRSVIKFGEPIFIERSMKVDETNTEMINQKMSSAWQAIDHSINPDFQYIPQSKNKK
ncbi:1-acyl-sn-glycerol-3-phosphate acyltransferase [Bombilactobacillus folatiphilus]|uniref:1-acyl-sn-glycerol-3-phosphate acyltransferase n=1 Tax=Bombilactobacillus folatiphilus TaxID=2923362 RepID=A0ABY4P7N2_9LACO|nr:1-acyl-sn-glycerol-3-phosphate acyltransferase [Bombilactobacillus folatiphilus]UQS81595.1 1-acyl-sn-glycerol-3-phosphate acyltransferase [Bombilactobacillus folatiphilus]